MSYFKRFTLPLVCIVSASACLLPSAAQAAEFTINECKNEKANWATTVKSITPASLQAEANAYADYLDKINGVRSSAKVFISSLPAKKPTDKAGIAAYNRTKVQEAAAVDKLAANAEADLQTWVSRAETDVEDTEAERTTKIDQNSTLAYNKLEAARACDEWNAETKHILDSRSLEDVYTAALQRSDACLLGLASWRLYDDPATPAVELKATWWDGSKWGRQATVDELNGTNGVQKVAPCPPGFGTGQRPAQTAYNEAAAKALAESQAHQQLCGKDPSYDYNPGGDFVSTAVAIPSVSGKPLAAAKTFLAGKGFKKLVVKKVKSNDSKVGNAVGTSPAAGTMQQPDKAVTILVRSNPKAIKGLRKGQIASASSAVMIAAASKKPKGKPLPKPKPPSAAAVAACRENEQTDPQHGSDAELEDVDQGFNNSLDDMETAYDQQTQVADTEYSRGQEDLDRGLTNPFAFAIPYNDSVTFVDQMVETTELRSDRKTTTDEWLVEDAATNAQRYLSELYNRDIEL